MLATCGPDELVITPATATFNVAKSILTNSGARETEAKLL